MWGHCVVFDAPPRTPRLNVAGGSWECTRAVGIIAHLDIGHAALALNIESGGRGAKLRRGPVTHRCTLQDERYFRKPPVKEPRFLKIYLATREH